MTADNDVVRKGRYYREEKKKAKMYKLSKTLL